MTNRATRRSAAAILRKSRLPEETVRLCLAPDLVAEYDALASDSLGDPNAERRAELEQEIRDATLVMRLRAVGQRRYDEIVALHPPRSGDKEDREAGYNRTEFAVALIKACTVEPEFSEEDWEYARDNLTPAEWARLAAVAIKLNYYGGEIPFSWSG